MNRNDDAPVRAKDVVAYLLDAVGSLQQLKLQKILYYCQAWSLAYDRGPLFNDEIEAWAAGPVVASVWRAHPYESVVSSDSDGDASNLSPTQRALVDAVYERYGNYTGTELSNLTHQETPWREARHGCADGERSSRIITQDAMRAFYSGLLEATV